MSHIPINIFHILVVAPFLLYVAIVRGQLVPSSLVWELLS
jgi:hypothetical protein